MSRLSARLLTALRLFKSWLTGDLLLVDVHGRSMEPTLTEGDHLFCSRGRSIWRGAIVVRSAGGDPKYATYQIKRLVGLAGDGIEGRVLQPGECWLEGDNKEASTDSRMFGPVRTSEIVAVVVARLRENEIAAMTPTAPLVRSSGLRAHARDIFEDWRHGVRTRHRESIDRFGFSPLTNHPYVPTPWHVVRKALDAIHVTADDVLLDYGCGKGRVLVAATRYPFKEIVGVELVPELAEIARRNVRRHRRCRVYNADAGLFSLPANVSVIYLFNPFVPAVAESVWTRIEESLHSHSRRIRIISYGPMPAQWGSRASGVRNLGPNLALLEL